MILKHPIITERALKLINEENKLTFIVWQQASKKEIKDEMEARFKVKVVKVNTTVLPDAKKKAYIKLAKENPAMDIITQLGLM